MFFLRTRCLVYDAAQNHRKQTQDLAEQLEKENDFHVPIRSTSSIKQILHFARTRCYHGVLVEKCDGKRVETMLYHTEPERNFSVDPVASASSIATA